VIERRAQAIDVAARVGVTGVGVILLRRRVFRRAHPAHYRLRAGIGGVPQLDEAKIYQHRAPIGVQDDVVGFDVPVDDALPMTIGQRIQQLLRPL